MVNQEDRSNLMRSELPVLNVPYWPPYNTAETDRVKQGQGKCIQPCYSRVIIPCDLWPFFHFSSKGGRSLAGGRSLSLSLSLCHPYFKIVFRRMHTPSLRIKQTNSHVFNCNPQPRPHKPHSATHLDAEP